MSGHGKIKWTNKSQAGQAIGNERPLLCNAFIEWLLLKKKKNGDKIHRMHCGSNTKQIWGLTEWDKWIFIMAIMSRFIADVGSCKQPPGHIPHLNRKTLCGETQRRYLTLTQKKNVDLVFHFFQCSCAAAESRHSADTEEWLQQHITFFKKNMVCDYCTKMCLKIFHHLSLIMKTIISWGFNSL